MPHGGTALGSVAIAWAVVGIVGFAGDAGAQIQAAEDEARSPVDDAAAREHFVLGRAAYRGADYEASLAHFQQAYELSGRSELLYNIGISADRLGLDAEALEAFERYLQDVEDPSREQEVRERIAFLRLSVEEAKRKEQRLAEAAAQEEATLAPTEERPGRKIPQSAIIGGSVLGAVGVAGVAIMAVGLSQSGVCVETDPAGACVSERTANAWTAVYGSIGIAALAGSALWFGMGHRRAKRPRETTWNLSPTGVVVSGVF